MPSDPHADRPVLWRGAPLSGARLAVILVHGRGGSAEDMLSLATELGVPDAAYAAPQAAGQTWYPYSFLAPLAQNEPGISSGLRVLSGLVDALAQHGLPPDRVGLLGFSQGACLALEFAARQAQRYAAVIGLSGGLIGPPGTPRDYPGSLHATPVFLGCSDVDPHIPLERVQESADVFRRLGAAVDERIYRQMGHTVNRDEVEAVRTLLTAPPHS
jgi:predicted esterase